MSGLSAIQQMAHGMGQVRVEEGIERRREGERERIEQEGEEERRRRESKEDIVSRTKQIEKRLQVIRMRKVVERWRKCKCLGL